MSMTNCVNCGSAKDVSAAVCPFCGTSYFDLSEIDLDESHPCIVKFKYRDNIFQMKCFVQMAEFVIQRDPLDISSLDGHRLYLAGNTRTNVNIEFVSAE